MGSTFVISGAGNSDIWAIVAVGISLLSALFTVLWSLRSERRGYLDNYWFREVTAPSCVEPAVKIRKRWSKRIEALGNTTIALADYRLLVEELESDVSRAIAKAWISRLFKGGLYLRIRKLHESVLDAVAGRLEPYVTSGLPFSAYLAVELSEDISNTMMLILKEAAQVNASNLKI